MLAYYPTIAPEEIRVVLVPPRDRITAELSEAAGDRALERIARGVIFKLNARVADARPGAVILQGRNRPRCSSGRPGRRRTR
ncbi:MAG: hypothetical protein U0841_18900 [Chloroflexia bacterium]